MRYIKDYVIRGNALRLINKGYRVRAVIKSDAYGFGLCEVFRVLCGVGISEFFLLRVEDAIRLRKINEGVTLYLLGVVDVGIEILREYRIIPVLSRYCDYLYYKDIPYALEYNTGMNRFGFDEIDESMLTDRNLCHVVMHAGCMSSDVVCKINEMIKRLEGLNIEYSVGGSMCLGRYKSIRCGLTLYEDAVEVYGRVVMTRDGVSGCVGYGDEVYKVMRLGVIDLGYYNLMKGRYSVIIKGRRYNALSTMCMNHMFIEADCDVRVGDICKIELEDTLSPYEMYVYMK